MNLMWAGQQQAPQGGMPDQKGMPTQSWMVAPVWANVPSPNMNTLPPSTVTGAPVVPNVKKK
jgi:hypothetical protein